MVKLQFDDFAAASSGLSGILRHAGSYDTPLDQPTSIEKHYSPRQAPTTKTNFMVTDFQMGFDPCICMKEANDSTQLGKLQFVFSDINTTNIEMTSRSIAVDEEITEAGLLDDFLNMSDINTENYEPGQRIYTKMNDLYSDYQKRLEKYREELDEQRSDFNFLKAFLGKVAPALTGTFVDNWTLDKVKTELKKDTIGPGAMGTLSDSEVMAELDNARKRYELNFDPSSFGVKALQGLTKGIIGIGFDFLSTELFPKTPAPVKPVAPVATFTEAVYRGTISDTSHTPGPQLYQPGGVTYGNDGVGYWGYGKADLGFSALPVYNKVLGMSALLKTPVAYAGYQKFPIVSSHEVLNIQNIFQGIGQPILQVVTRERTFTSTSSFKIRLEDLVIALNRSLDFDLDLTKSFVQIELNLKNMVPANETWAFGGDSSTSHLSVAGNMFLQNDYDDQDGPGRSRVITSKWIELTNLNQMVFSAEFRDSLRVIQNTTSPSFPVVPFSMDLFGSEVMEVKLKILQDNYFAQIGSQGDQVNTSQVTSYLLYKNGVDDTPLSIEELTNFDTEIFNQYLPGLLTLGNETITTTHPLVHEVIGNEIFINAQEVQITGPIQVEPGYTLVVQALEQIQSIPGASFSPNVHLRIKKDFYDTPVFEYADNAMVYNFCNNSSAYQANTPSAALRQRIEEALAAQEPDALGKAIAAPQSSITLYPNPARSELTVQSQGAGIDRLTIFDMATRPVMQASPGGQSLYRMDIGKLAPGVYIVRAECAGEVLTEKLVVAR